MPAWNVPVYADIEGSFLLQVVRVRGKPVQLAGDNDRVRILALARELAQAAKTPRAASAEALMLLPPPPPLEVVEEDSRDVVTDRDEQPSGSTATLEQHADGITITVPPLGFRSFIRYPLLILVPAVLAVLTVWIAARSGPAVAREGLVGLFTFDGSFMAWLCALILTVVLAYVLSRPAQLTARRAY